MSAIVVDRFCEVHKLLPCDCVGAVKPKRNKFGAIPQRVDGIHFASTKEANRYRTLKQKLDAGEIADLKCHPRFPLYAWNFKDEKAIKIGDYVADFSYRDTNNNFVVEDCKSRATMSASNATDKSRWKIKHYELQEGVKVRIV